jgi:hypothetical protein
MVVCTECARYCVASLAMCLVVYGNARGSAAVCGSAAEYASAVVYGCTLVRQCAAVRAAVVCGNTCGRVQCVAVRTAVCGSARGSEL